MSEVTKEDVFELIEKTNYMTNNDDWRSKLRRTATTNALKKTTTNAEIILGNDESLNNLVQYDVFENVTKLNVFLTGVQKTIQITIGLTLTQRMLFLI